MRTNKLSVYCIFRQAPHSSRQRAALVITLGSVRYYRRIAHVGHAVRVTVLSFQQDVAIGGPPATWCNPAALPHTSAVHRQLACSPTAAASYYSRRLWEQFSATEISCLARLLYPCPLQTNSQPLGGPTQWATLRPRLQLLIFTDGIPRMSSSIMTAMSNRRA